MNRRAFLGSLVAGSVAAASGRWELASAEEKLPHIVYILADDLGYGDVACLNKESKIPAPNIDRIAREGMAFTDAHSGSAVCTPTRYGILTGRYSWRSRMKQGVLNGYDTPLIEPGRATVASLLKNRGYRTVCVGKWHLGLGWATTNERTPRPGNVDYSKPVENGPCALGFDHCFVIPASLDMPPYCYVEDDHVFEAPTETTPGDTGKKLFREGEIAPSFRPEDVLPTFTRKAVEHIERHAKEHAGDPLFLYLPLPAPHTPILPVAPYAGSTNTNEYGDFVAQVDGTVGQVREALEHAGMLENTLLIVTSDNGCAPMAGIDELHAKGHYPSYHFRGHKADIFDGGHRIPFVARWPGHVPAGANYDETICLTDLMATAATIVGEKLPDNAGEDSVSLLPALTGETQRAVRDATVHHSVSGFFAIRQGPWKLILCGHSGGWSDPKPQDARTMDLPRVQLYNLTDDPSEKMNLEAEHPEIVERLTRLLESYVETGRSTPGAPQPNDGKVNIWGPGAGKE